MRTRWWKQRPATGEPQIITRADYSIVAFVVLLAIGVIPLAAVRPHTHAVVFDVPVENQLGNPFEPWPDDTPTHLLSLSAAGEILWDGQAISFADLLDNIDSATSAAPRHAIVFEREAHASYDLAARVMNILAQAGATADRFCLGGLHQYAHVADERQTARRMTSIWYPAEWALERGDRADVRSCAPAH